MNHSEIIDKKRLLKRACIEKNRMHIETLDFSTYCRSKVFTKIIELNRTLLKELNFSIKFKKEWKRFTFFLFKFEMF